MIELGLGADVIRGIRDFIRMHIFNMGDKATVSKGLSCGCALFTNGQPGAKWRESCLMSAE